MRIEVRDGAGSREAIAPLVAATYPPEVLATVAWRNVVSARATHRILVYDGPTLVAAAGLLFRTGTVDGLRVEIAGLGGVMTLPERRRRGFGSAAVKAVHEIVAERGSADFGLLFCEPHNVFFHEALGWVRHEGENVAEQHGVTGPYNIMTAMVRAAGEVAPVRGVIDLCGLPW